MNGTIEPANRPSMTDGLGKDRPPFLRTWRNIYILMIIVLVLEVAVLYMLTRYYT